jgi:hypothetical protein
MATKRVYSRCPCGFESVAEMDQGASNPDAACACGGVARVHRIAYEPKSGWSDPAPDNAPYAFVKGRPYEQQGQFQVMPQGERYGVSEARQREHYREYFGSRANASKAFRNGHSKLKGNTPEYLGGMSGEQFHSIGLQEGDNEVVAKDPVTFLKKTGNYVGQ